MNRQKGARTASKFRDSPTISSTALRYHPPIRNCRAKSRFASVFFAKLACLSLTKRYFDIIQNIFLLTCILKTTSIQVFSFLTCIIILHVPTFARRRDSITPRVHAFINQERKKKSFIAVFCNFFLRLCTLRLRC